MTIITGEQLDQAFEKMPKNLKEAFYSFDTDTLVASIGQKHTVHIDALGALQAQVIYTIIGLAKPDDFGKDVLEATSLPKETINAVVRDINEQIFKPIRARMMELDEEDRILAEPDEPEANEVTQIETPTTNPGTTVETFPTEITGKVTPFVKAPTGSQNIVTEKLQAPHTITPTTTSHDLPTMSTVRTYKGSDPYREGTE
jgi:hypothetical protein